jgi:tetratricopeptide (TPR) repeat protein
MSRSDHDFTTCRALIVDGHPTSRSTLCSQMRALGVNTVVQCGRIADARRHLEFQSFDLVLCEQNFKDELSTGQSLLDDLRRAQLLPFSTVFAMVTSESGYAAVAEAAESALDSYLIKPFSAATLADRLVQARCRKRVLGSIFTAIEAGQFDQAARMCLQRFQAREQFWLYAARIGAELLLRLNQPAAAQTLYQAVIEAKTLPWAKLGVARAQVEGNQLQQARRTLDVLIADDPEHADAYDVLGRLHTERGDLAEALATYRTASQLTPGSIERLQRQGTLAFFLGQTDEARKALDRAASIGISSKMYDHQCTVLLAFTRLRERDGQGLQRCADNLRHALERSQDDPRMVHLNEVIEVMLSAQHRQPERLAQQLQAMASQLGEPGYTLEMAINLLALLSELSRAGMAVPPASLEWIETITLRFCVSRCLAELLIGAASAHPAHADQIKATHVRLNALAEESMAHSLNGNPRHAAESLLRHGESTRNRKLIDMAGMVLQRHAAKVADDGSLKARVDALTARYATPAATVTGHQRRQGGLALRADPFAAPASTVKH